MTHHKRKVKNGVIRVHKKKTLLRVLLLFERHQGSSLVGTVLARPSLYSMTSCMLGCMISDSSGRWPSASLKSKSSSLPLSASAPSREEGSPGNRCTLQREGKMKENKSKTREGGEKKGTRGRSVARFLAYFLSPLCRFPSIELRSGIGTPRTSRGSALRSAASEAPRRRRRFASCPAFLSSPDPSPARQKGRKERPPCQSTEERKYVCACA